MTVFNLIYEHKLPFSSKLLRALNELVEVGRALAPVATCPPPRPPWAPRWTGLQKLPSLLSPRPLRLQYVWDRMLGGFKHKNFRTREGTCLCLVATLNA